MTRDQDFPARRYRLGGVLVNPAAREITASDGPRRVSPKAIQVLEALAEAGGEVVSREDLLDRVWPDVTVGEEVLTQAVAELRRALGDRVRPTRCIETVHKTGYRLRMPVGSCDNGDMPQESSSLVRAPLEGFDLSAYALYLQSCKAFDRGGKANLQDAVAGFAAVIRSQPGFAPAYAGLARSLAFVDMYYGPPGDHLSRALEACDAGLRIDPASHEVLAAQGTAFSAAGNASRAFTSFEAALRLRPDSGPTHYLLGRALFAEGQFLAAALMQEEAARLDPDDFHSLLLAAKARRRIGDARGARADLVRANQRIEQHLLAYPDDFRALCDNASCLIELDRKDAALNLTEPLVEHGDPLAYYLVCVLACLGDVPRALELLDEVVEAGWSHAAVLRYDPDIDPLRGEAQFRRIEQRIKQRCECSQAQSDTLC
jgi:DNA-binding winged helix-turn-helix (wHTH) protein